VCLQLVRDQKRLTRRLSIVYDGKVMSTNTVNKPTTLSECGGGKTPAKEKPELSGAGPSVVSRKENADRWEDYNHFEWGPEVLRGAFFF